MKRNSLGLLLLLIVLFYSCLSNDPFNSKTQFKSDTLSIKQFLSDSSLFASRTPEGVWYSSDTAIGIYPVLSDTVTISYTAYDIRNYKELDNAEGLPKLLSATISGLQIGLPRFTVGSHGRLYVPSGMAYGTIGNDSIPPNTTLLFKINLVSAKGSRLTSDTTALKTYINSEVAADPQLLHRIVHKLPSGIFYAYDTLISGALSPAPSSSVELSYTGKVLNSSTPFVNSTDTTLVLKNQIAALRIILPLIKEGTTVEIYVPSGYGYGSAFTSTSIPENANLVYRVKLIKVL